MQLRNTENRPAERPAREQDPKNRDTDFEDEAPTVPDAKPLGADLGR